MLSKGKVKYIHSLEMKKYRNELNAFVAEGNKLVADMMFAFECELILAKPSWMAMQGNIPAKELLEAEGDDIRKGHNGRTGTRKSPLYGTGRLPESPGGKTNSVVRYIPRRRKHVHKGIVDKRNHRDGERRERNTSANRKVD